METYKFLFLLIASLNKSIENGEKPRTAGQPGTPICHFWEFLQNFGQTLKIFIFK